MEVEKYPRRDGNTVENFGRTYKTHYDMANRAFKEELMEDILKKRAHHTHPQANYFLYVEAIETYLNDDSHL